MGSVINLRTVRKQQDRDAKAEAGARNAARFGTSKAERSTRQAEAAALRHKLDQHLIDTDDD